MQPGFRRPAAVVTAAVMVTAVGAGVACVGGSFGNHPLGTSTVGQQSDGSYLTQTNQFVTPAGDVTKENGRPFGLALSPDGKTAAALNTGGATTGIVTVFDLVNHTVLQQTGSGKISDGGVLYSPDGKYLWVARPADLQRFTVNPDGTVGNPITVALPGVGGRKAVPAGLAWAPDGRLLVALSANNTLSSTNSSSLNIQTQEVGRLSITLQVLPGKIHYANTVIVSMKDRVTGSLVTDADVTLSINMVVMDMGTASATIKGGNPTYIAVFDQRAAFSMPGAWSIKLTIQRPNEAPVEGVFTVTIGA